MGLENRDYSQDENSWQGSYGRSSAFGGGGSGGRTGPLSIVMILIIANVVVFMADAFSTKLSPEEFQFSSPDSPVHWLVSWLGMKTDSLWRVWTFITYGFTHSAIDSRSGFWHIGGNMIALFFLGRPVEARLGRHEFLKFYLTAIVIAGLAFVLVRMAMGNSSFIVGASGGVAAVVMLFVFMYPREKVLLFGVVPMPAWLLGILLVGGDILTAFRPESHIAFESHLAGAAFAAAYFYFKWNFNWIDLEKIPNPFSAKPNLKIHAPNAKDERLKEQGDAILAKISEQGEESLTSAERRVMKRYSKLLRKNRD